MVVRLPRGTNRRRRLPTAAPSADEPLPPRAGRRSGPEVPPTDRRPAPVHATGSAASAASSRAGPQSTRADRLPRRARPAILGGMDQQDADYADPDAPPPRPHLNLLGC